MTLPTEDDVRSVLTPFHSRIRDVVALAWAEYQAIQRYRAKKGMKPLLYPRTIANDVFDAIARFALEEFGSSAGVNVKIEAQTIKLFFKGKVCGRFKKGDEEGLGRNIPTFAALAFEEAESELPGFPPETAKVEFVWAANELGTALEKVSVVARDGDRVLWNYEIPTSEGSAEVIPFPPATPKTGGRAPLITPKPTKVKKPTSDRE